MERALHAHRLGAGQLLQPLDARLRLLGLAGLGAEAVDERLQVRALGLLLLVRDLLLAQLFGALALERGVVAGVQAPACRRADAARARPRRRGIRGRARSPAACPDSGAARPPATARRPGPGGWWVRPAAAGRTAPSARAPGSGARASRRRTRPPAARRCRARSPGHAAGDRRARGRRSHSSPRCAGAPRPRRRGPPRTGRGPRRPAPRPARHRRPARSRWPRPATPAFPAPPRPCARRRAVPAPRYRRPARRGLPRTGWTCRSRCARPRRPSSPHAGSGRCRPATASGRAAGRSHGRRSCVMGPGRTTRLTRSGRR